MKSGRQGSKRGVAELVVGAALLLPAVASAQGEPKFDFGKVEEVKATR